MSKKLNRRQLAIPFLIAFITIESSVDLSFLYGPIVLLLAIFFGEKDGKIRLLSRKHYGLMIKCFLTLMISIAVFTLISLLNGGNGNYSYDGIKAFIATVFFTFIVFVLLARTLDWDCGLVIQRNIAIPTAVLGVAETLTRVSITSRILPFVKAFNNGNYDHNAQFRTSIFWGHPTIAAAILLFELIICLYYPFKKTWIQTVSVILIIISIYGTKTRSVWIAVVIIGVMFLLSRAKFRSQFKKKTVIRILSVIGLLIILVIIFRNQLQTMLRTISSYLNLALDKNNQYVSRVVRTENLRNGISYIKSNPIVLLIGNGLGFGDLFSFQHGVKLSYGAVWNAGIDNEYLSVVLETGIWGLIPIIIIPIYSFINFFRTDITENKVGYMLIVAIAILGIFFNILGWRITTFLYLFGIFMTNKNGRLYGRSQGRRYISQL